MYRLPSLVLLILLSLFLARCDSAVPAEEATEQELTFTRIPSGNTLFGGYGKSASDTAYGCYISSPNFSTLPSERYRYSGFYLTFPDHVMDQAQGQKRVLILDIGSPTLYTETPRTTAAFLRQLRCVIPDVGEAKTMLVEQMLQFEQHGQRWDGQPMPGHPNGDAGAGKGAGTVCHQFVVREWTEACSSEGCVITEDYSYTQTICYEGGTTSDGSPDDPTEPSNGGTPTGPDGDTCDGQVMPEADQEGLGCNAPADPLPYLPAGLDKATLKADYEQLCAAELAQFAGDPMKMEQAISDLFEGDVRRSLGFDAGGTDAFDSNRQFDGTRSPLNRDGYTQPGYYSDILEVKFSEGSYAISGRSLTANRNMRQAKAIIDNLSRVYEVNVGGVRYLPMFTLVTMSQSPVDAIDELGLIPDYADMYNVNLLHYHLYENAAGNRFLQGEIIGDKHFGAFHIGGQDYVLEKPNVISSTKTGTFGFQMSCQGI